MSTEYRLVSFRQPLSKIISPNPTGMMSLTIDFLGSIPEVAEQLDGWTAIGSQILPVGNDDFVVILTLKLDHRAPDTAEGVT